MPVTQEGLMALHSPAREYEYGERETMLYAAGVGMGADPMDRDELAYVYEKDLKVLPSMATVIAWDDSLIMNSGLDPVRIVHGEQRLRLHRPLPPRARISSAIRVKAAYDKGQGGAAVLVTATEITDRGDGRPLCSLESVVFARGEGGYGGPAGSPDALPTVPERAPDHTAVYRTLPQAALIYRLSGDRNPLHCDPDVAAAAGFERPILHGLCTWGHACRAVVQSQSRGAPERIRSFAARFSAPVFPGESLETLIWREGSAVHFRTRVPERDIMVLDRGFAELDG